MAKYVVLVHVLDRVDETKGFYDDGRPKKIIEHRRGEVVDFSGTPEDRVDELVRLKAIKPANEKGGQSASSTEQPPGPDTQKAAQSS